MAKLKIQRHFTTAKQKDMEQMDLEIFKIIKEFGFNEDEQNRLVVCSLQVSDKFDKRHSDVIRAIETQIEICTPKFTERNFALSEYKDKSGKTNKMYLLTRDGFMKIVFGFTGKNASLIQEAYIEKFNIMGNWIVNRLHARSNCKKMTDSLIEYRLEQGKDTSFFHYTNEMDMINKLVLGVNAKKFKELNNIDSKVQSIRDYLSKDQIYLVDELQNKNTQLIELGMGYEERKALLNSYKIRLTKKLLT